MEEDPFLAAGIDIPAELPYPELTGIISSVIGKSSPENTPKIDTKNKDELKVLDHFVLGASTTMLATANPIDVEDSTDDTHKVETETNEKNGIAQDSDSNQDIPEVIIESKSDEVRGSDKKADSDLSDFNFMYPIEKRFMPQVSITSDEKFENNA